MVLVCVIWVWGHVWRGVWEAVIGYHQTMGGTPWMAWLINTSLTRARWQSHQIWYMGLGWSWYGFRGLCQNHGCRWPGTRPSAMIMLDFHSAIKETPNNDMGNRLHHSTKNHNPTRKTEPKKSMYTFYWTYSISGFLDIIGLEVILVYWFYSWFAKIWNNFVLS